MRLMIATFLVLAACGDKEQDTAAEEAEVEEVTEEEAEDSGESEDTSSEVEE